MFPTFNSQRECVIHLKYEFLVIAPNFFLMFNRVFFVKYLSVYFSVNTIK